MAYLLKRDYLVLIDEENLDVVTYSENENATPEAIIEETEQSTKQEILSYLAGRFDTSNIFPDVLEYLAGETYTKNALVFLEADPLDTAGTFQIGFIASKGGKVYKAMIADAAGADYLNDNDADPAPWVVLGENKAWYSALADTNEADLFTNEAVWKSGDTRNALMKRHVINIALYELHSRINPRNIPAFRISRRDDSIAWLKMVQNPRNNVSAEFLTLKDFGEKRGNDMSWNSKKKQQNDY